MTTILAFIAVLGTLVFVHEFGHFIVAKMCGVYVDCFSLGFGPKILSLKVGETEYRISIIPLGGYVRMAGQFDVPEEYDDEASERYQDVPAHRRYDAQSIPRRLAIIVAGPFMNLFFALPVAILLLTYGINLPLDIDKTMVGSVIPESPAAISGIVPGDEIVKVGDQPVNSWQSMVTKLTGSINTPTTVTYERNDEPITVEITPVLNEAAGFMGIGIQPMQRAQIAAISDGSPASESDFQDGDVIDQLVGLYPGEIPYSILLDKIRENPDSKLIFHVKRYSSIRYNDQSNTYTTAKVTCETIHAGKFEHVVVVKDEGKNILLVSENAPTNFPVKTGDVLVKINDYEAKDKNMHEYISALPAGSTAVTIEKMNGKIAKYVQTTNLFLNVKSVGQIGVAFQPASQKIKYEFGAAVKKAPAIAYDKFVETLQVLKLLVQRKISIKSLAGPIGIARMAGSAAKMGFDKLLILMLLLTVNLGILNLLPIPVLDGGHVVLLFIESIYRKALPINFVLWYQKIGFVLVMGLIAIVIFQDINRLMTDSTPIGIFVGKIMEFFKQF